MDENVDESETGPRCPACGTEMAPDGVDTAEGLESCHRCPRCKLVILVPGLWSDEER
jgi:tRNA(Ile2) C34 agmatinyltransferase TiaS